MGRGGIFFVALLAVIIFVFLCVSVLRLGGMTSSAIVNIKDSGSGWLPVLLIVLLLVLLVIASLICKGLIRKAPPFKIEGNI